METVVQEDADAVGLSVLSGAHMTQFARLTELMRERGLDDVVVFGGGIIPDEDVPELERLGVATVLCLSLPAADVPDELRTDPATGLQTVVSREGPQALLERPELALLGGLLLAGALLLCSVVAPSLRPRLAAVGGLLALTVAVLAAGLGGLRDAAYSDELVWTVPGAGLVLLGLAFAALTTFAWRARRTR